MTLNSILKINKGKEFKRHTGGISYNQMNMTFFIRNNPKLGYYGILDGKTISWIIENCEYVEKFYQIPNKDDIIIYCSGFFEVIRSYGIGKWEKLSMEMKKVEFKKFLMQILGDYDEDTSKPLISFFTDFKLDGNGHTMNYYMLKSWSKRTYNKHLLLPFHHHWVLKSNNQNYINWTLRNPMVVKK